MSNQSYLKLAKIIYDSKFVIIYLINKCTECESSQFGSNRGRITIANAANVQCIAAKSVERAVSKGAPLMV